MKQLQRLDELNKKITRCKKCPRLASYIRTVAKEKVKRFSDQKYWGRPITGFAFQIEMLCYLKKKGFKGIELPTTFVDREKGRSKMGLTEAIQFLNTCLILLMKRIRS